MRINLGGMEWADETGRSSKGTFPGRVCVLGGRGYVRGRINVRGKGRRDDSEGGRKGGVE